MHGTSAIRSRSIQRADLATTRLLEQHGVTWERAQPSGRGRLYESRHRIIAISYEVAASITPPPWQAEPLPEITLTAGGDQRALIGQGLIFSRDATPADVRGVFRLARTLKADELGVRWTLIQAPLPQLEGYSAAAIAQQIKAGAIDFAPISVPLADGFWPVGTDDGQLVLLRRNDAF